MRVTLKDIARHTGLSVATVSLVLNNKVHRFSEETRQRVLAASRELNYRPNQLAVGLITKRTRTVGLILPDITNMFFSEVAKGVQTRCQALGYNMILCNTNDDPGQDVESINVLMDRGVDGVLLTMAANASGNMALECCEIMRYMEKPMVLIDRTIPDAPVPSVLVNHELGGYLATRHLLELGHRRIGCITGPMSLQSSKQRFFGYIRALQEYSVHFDPELVEETEFQMTSDFGRVSRLLERDATAIFAYNDLIAYGVYRQAVQHKLRIPRDFSLVGFDDLFFSELLEVPLTSVDQPVVQMGEEAAAMLVEMIEAENPARRENVMFTPSLVVRKSTQRPRETANLYSDRT